MANSMNPKIIILIVASLTILETFGQAILHRGRTQHTGDMLFPILTWATYGVCTILLYISYGYTSMGYVELLWDALTTLSVPLADYIINSEKLSRLELLGMSLTFIGTCFVAYSRIIKKF